MYFRDKKMFFGNWLLCFDTSMLCFTFVGGDTHSFEPGHYTSHQGVKVTAQYQLKEGKTTSSDISDRSTPGGLTTSVTFTVEELWLLQSAIRHEMTQQDNWHSPPVSLELNDQIAHAILFCVKQEQTEAALVLTHHDCLVIDYCVSQNAKSASGAPTGKVILTKSF